MYMYVHIRIIVYTCNILYYFLVNFLKLKLTPNQNLIRNKKQSLSQQYTVNFKCEVTRTLETVSRFVNCCE